jgi:MinD-like ATPase involved in chromosome partitioning or flagellar assembly
MAKIISVHSFRGGTGKSNTAANVSALIAAQGLCVGVIDTDIVSPGIHVLFGVTEDNSTHTLNDYLWGKCNIEDTALDVTKQVNGDLKGRIFFVPSSMRTGDIARVLREGYDVGLLNDGYQRMVEKLHLDVLIVDTHPGLNEETLLSIAVSDALAILMRPDSQDYQGTAVTVEVARKLDVPRMMLVINKTPPSINPKELKARAEKIFDCEVAAVLPHSDEMMSLASEGIFVLRYPNHAMTKAFQQVADRLMSAT